MPRLTVIVGANGSGKSTWIQNNRFRLPRSTTNTDMAAASLGAPNDELHMRFARDYIERFTEHCIENGIDLCLESTYSGRRKPRFVRDTHGKGWEVHCVYFATSNPRINVERVRQRLSAGGHGIDSDKIVQVWRAMRQNVHDTWDCFDRIEILDADIEKPSMIKTIGIKEGDLFTVPDDQGPVSDMPEAHRETILLGLEKAEEADLRKKNTR